MLTILPSRTLTIWPQPTAQYGQMLANSRAPCSLFRITSAAALAGFRSRPSPARLPSVIPVPRKNWRRLVEAAPIVLVSSEDRSPRQRFGMSRIMTRSGRRGQWVILRPGTERSSADPEGSGEENSAGGADFPVRHEIAKILGSLLSRRLAG